jgi:glycosyltransferase involved in cell wall biosynthesis
MSANLSPLHSIALVVPRYGEHLGGGAEALAKALLERLHLPQLRGLPSIPKCEVWTTCAVDHRTWENALPAGLSVENGIPVRRFPVDERNVDIFLRAEFAMRDGKKLSLDEQLDWLQNSVNSSGLYRHIERHGEEFSAILFAPYLFATSFWGALIHPDRSILLPCLHNEHYAYQDVFRALFSQVRGLIFNAHAERELAEQLYNRSFRDKSGVVGMGFEGESSAPKKSLSGTNPFLLYSGRKEQGKNVDLLIRYYEELPESLRAEVELILIGSGTINFRDSLPDGVRDLGFVSEDEKSDLMRRSLALCQPSTNESFSIVMMEAWRSRTAVLVHSACAVTREHVLRSGGGLYFGHPREFAAVVRTLLSEPKLRGEMAEAGAKYVAEEYSWHAVLNRAWETFDRLGYHPVEATVQTEAAR